MQRNILLKAKQLPQTLLEEKKHQENHVYPCNTHQKHLDESIDDIIQGKTHSPCKECDINDQFFSAACRLDLEKIKILIKNHPKHNINIKFNNSIFMSNQCSLLMSAIDEIPRYDYDREFRENNRLELVQLLLKQNADVNYQNPHSHYIFWGGKTVIVRNETALMIAIREGHIKIVELLLKHNADLHLKNGEGETALTMVHKMKSEFEKDQVKFFVNFLLEENEINHLLKTIEEHQHKEKQKKLFFIENKSMQIVQVEQDFYALKKSLDGRGNGIGGIYQSLNDSKCYVIKEDKDPAISVLEGSAKELVQTFMHDEKAINFAKCSTLRHVNSEKNEVAIITIQAFIENSQPWDKIVFGKKRNPKSPWSTEDLNKKPIAKHLASLSNKVQWDIAKALFGKAIAGDESQHFGQFMAILDEKRNICGITGIDLGARERDASLREKTKEFHPHKTSIQYTKGGQIGNDYISFILKNRSILMKYLYLCATLDTRLISNATSQNRKSFRAQMAKIPDSQKTKILNKIYDIYTGNDKTLERKKDQNITQKEIEDIISTVVPARLKQIHSEAQSIITDMLHGEYYSELFKYNMELHSDYHIAKIRSTLFISTSAAYFQDVLIDSIESLLYKLVFHKLFKEDKEVNNHVMLSKAQDLLLFLYTKYDYKLSDGQEKNDILQQIELYQIRTNILETLMKDKKISDLLHKNFFEFFDGIFKDPNKVIEKVKILLGNPSGISIFKSNSEKLINQLNIEIEKYNKIASLKINPEMMVR